MGKKIRVLIAKPGLDGHDRGSLVISQALRDHGMEIIYTGLRQTPVQIAQAAIQEDVDVIGLSSLSGAHKTLFPKVIEELKKRDASDISVVGGGVIPSGSPTTALANYIQELIDPTKDRVTEPKRIAHIGIAVQNIDQALPFYINALGLQVEAVEEVASESVKVAFLRIGESRIELLEPLDDTSPIQRFIDNKGEGVHHVALEVDNIHHRLEQLKQSGIEFINKEPKEGAKQSQIAFIHPNSANGVLFELCQHVEGSED